MSDDSMASFIKLMTSSGLLPADWDEQRLNELNVENPKDLVDSLLTKALLTTTQAEFLLTGRATELTTADYNIVAAAPEHGEGAYQALQKPTGRLALLRSWTSGQLAPADSVPAFASRVQAAQGIHHEHLTAILGCYVREDQVSVLTAWPDGSDLKALVMDMGPMPIQLALDYIRQAAEALAVAHEAGVTHGDIHPKCLKIAPLVLASKPRPDGTPRYRPSATAKVLVSELGEVPNRTRATDWPAEWGEKKDFLAPERMIHSEKTKEGDVYSLAACLFYLLTSHRLTFGPLAKARLDVPAKLHSHFQSATATDPALRPTMSAFARALQEIIQLPPESQTPAVPPSAEVPIGVIDQPVPDLSDLNQPTQNPVEGWRQYETISTDQAQDVWIPQAAPSSTDLSPRTPRKTKSTFTRRQIWMLAGAFVGLNLIALALWILIVVKPFAPKSPDNQSSR